MYRSERVESSRSKSYGFKSRTFEPKLLAPAGDSIGPEAISRGFSTVASEKFPAH